MGHVFTEEGVCADPAKVEAIVKMPQPKDNKALQRFFGMVKYLNPFCPALLSTIHSLHNLTRKDVPYMWAPVHTAAFEKAIELISTAPCLTFFNTEKPVVLQVDASDSGLGRSSSARCYRKAATGLIYLMSAQAQ